MSTQPSPFETKTVFHSKLVAEGPINVTITGEPSPSKFKPGTWFIGFKVRDHEHIYNIENDNCKAALTGYKGQTVCLIAEGSKDDATITLTEPAAETAPVERTPAPRAAAPAPRAAAPAAAAPRAAAPNAAAQRALDGGGMASFKKKLAQRIVAVAVIEKGIHAMLGDRSGEDLHAIRATLFISLDRDGCIEHLPTSLTSPRAPEPPPAPAAPAAPPDDLAESEIPF